MNSRRLTRQIRSAGPECIIPEFVDSFGHTFYALTDGSYLLQTEDRAEIRGEAYMIHDGEIIQISADGDVFSFD